MMLKLERYNVPTGDILVVKGDKGSLECLSLYDYGKDVNVKADFLGLDREPERVEHTDLLSLHEKWVVTISTQYGCSMGCKFCDVPNVGPGINATLNDLVSQVETSLSLHPDITWSDRLNIHFARMGEPSWNPDVLKAARIFRSMANFKVHPVVSTMMPRGNKWLECFLRDWMRIKNFTYTGNAGLQLSINSTSDVERLQMFNGNSLSLADIGLLMGRVVSNQDKVYGRKITLNFAVAGYEINPDILLQWFDPDKYIIKLTPMHKTGTALENGIETSGDYTQYHPYQKHEEMLRKAGYDVLVFIASKYEDLSTITCGNAILGGSEIRSPYKVIHEQNEEKTLQQDSTTSQ